MTKVAPTLQAYFTEGLIRQRQASPHTVAAYRDTVRLLFVYVADTSGKMPAELDFDDLDAATISGFLTHLEEDRKVSVATRNTRLAALHSLFRFASFRHPEHAATIARVLDIPAKRAPAARHIPHPNRGRRTARRARAGQLDGRRDYTMLVFGIQTGLRVSELVASPARRSTSGTAPRPGLRD